MPDKCLVVRKISLNHRTKNPKKQDMKQTLKTLRKTISTSRKTGSLHLTSQINQIPKRQNPLKRTRLQKGH